MKCLQCVKSIINVDIVSFLSMNLNSTYCFTEQKVKLTLCKYPYSCFLKVEVTKRQIVPADNIFMFERVIINILNTNLHTHTCTYIYIYIYIYIDKYYYILNYLLTKLLILFSPL